MSVICACLDNNLELTMEGNKEEAVKCRRIAEKYLSEGNKIKAEKLFRKAQRLYPSSEVEGSYFLCLLFRR